MSIKESKEAAKFALILGHSFGILEMVSKCKHERTSEEEGYQD